MTPFKLQSLVRIAFLTATFCLSIYFFTIPQYALALCLLLAGVFQIWSFFKFTDMANAEILRFLQGINYSDFSQHTRFGALGSSFRELSDELERIIENFRKARIEKEESLQYLQTVVEHVEVGLVCFDAQGDVALYNKTAGRLLSTPFLKNLSALNKKHDRLGDILFEMTPDTKRTCRLQANGTEFELLMSATEFRMKNHPMKLISLHNIQQELEANEIEAWQKLIKVLTHEIMNSITPISSLASTVDVMLQQTPTDGMHSAESIDDIRSAVSTIHKRSEGLIHFVNKYRDISKMPRPNLQTIRVSDLVYRVRLLMDQTFSAGSIEFVSSVIPETLEVTADPELMEQVLLNLMHNSVHALDQETGRRISIAAGIDERGKTMIRVADNGKGIPPEVIDSIFIPFFSTKPEGSGIGLSISQRIVRAHGGTLRAVSHPGAETVFTITL
ncbi:MAG TPA: ATP-binding protein [Bacteroidota bacterium]|nr:ATP-binding protein [Bacteroidota bacterium]